MCGRYWINSDDAALSEIISEMQCLNVPAKITGEIFPGDPVPVLCKSRSEHVRPFAMEWGYRLSDGRRVINARSETAREKNLFRDGMALRRCLLPMSAYFEWEKQIAGKQKYRIAPKQEGIHYIAGIYRFENTKPTCTVLTTTAAPNIAFIHNRMPIILSESERDDWIFEGEINWSRRPPLVYSEV